MDDAKPMQPQDAPPAAHLQPTTMQPSVVGGDLYTAEVKITAHHGESVKSSLSHTVLISTGLIVVAILLAIFGVLSDDWAVEEESETIEGFGTKITIKTESKIGLDDFSSTVCINGNCTIQTYDLGSEYDNCTSNAADLELTSSETEEICGGLGDTARAGLTGMILITMGICVMLTTLLATFMSTRGTVLPYAQYYPFGGAALTLVGVIAWKTILPEGDASLGYSAWMTIASIVLATAAGGYTVYMERTPRIPGLGVRALTTDPDAREFVLRENAMGTKSTSLVEQGKVLRLVHTKLHKGNIVAEDHFIIQKESLTGFTHYRYDWLDNGKYMWWLMTTFGIFSLFKDSQQSPLLLVGVLLSLAQLFDPELLSFETNSRRHRLLLYRQDSNRELTNFSMNQIDSKMQQLLSGGQLDGSSIKVKAAEIEEKRSAEIIAKQEAAAALELAKVSAATAPEIAPIPTPIAIPGIEPPQPPIAEAEPIVAWPEVVIPAPPAPTEVQSSLPPPLPLPPQAQPLPPLPLINEPLPPPPQAQPLPPLPLIDEPLPPPPPLWGN
jgi:hypothetical protein